MTLPTTQAVHATFTIEREYPHAPSKVFRSFADGPTKRRWFAEGDGFTCDEFASDFRAGGHELLRFRAPDGSTGRNDTVYMDIVTDERIVLAYTMTYNGASISCSLLTIALASSPTGTRLTLTEQGLYYPNSDGPVGREHGTRELLEALARELALSAR
jgi:uncharacterized protein YndB with AHSA1/START domain